MSDFFKILKGEALISKEPHYYKIKRQDGSEHNIIRHVCICGDIVQEYHVGCCGHAINGWYNYECKCNKYAKY